MKAVGIDLGTRKCGLAVLSKSDTGRVTLCVSDTISSKHENSWDRIYQICSELLVELSRHKPGIVVFERVRLFHQGGINLDSIVLLARMQGVIGYWCLDNSAKLVEVHVQHWRRSVLGDGTASKSDVRSWVQDKYGVSLGEDESEAVALAHYGIEYAARKNLARRRKWSAYAASTNLTARGSRKSCQTRTRKRRS